MAGKTPKHFERGQFVYCDISDDCPYGVVLGMVPQYVDSDKDMFVIVRFGFIGLARPVKQDLVHDAGATRISRGTTVDDDLGKHHPLVAAMDDCLVAMEDGHPLPARAIAALPPWRAVMVARVAGRAGIPIEGGTLDELVAQAREITGSGTLTWPPRRS